MVEISVCRTDNEGQIRLQGHAGGINERGEDIVCACVSTIVTLLAQVLDNHPDVFFDVKEQLESGNSFISYRIGFGREEDGNLIVDTVITGFQLLEATRPDCVKTRQQAQRKDS